MWSVLILMCCSVQFYPAQTYLSGEFTVRAAAGDLDRDGLPDIAVPAMLGERILVGWNKGGRFRFETLELPSARGALKGIAIADTDGNGEFEVIAGGVDIDRQVPEYIVYDYTGAPDVSPSVTQYGINHIAVGNLDGNRADDLVTILTNDKFGVVLDGDFDGMRICALGARYSKLEAAVIADFDRDGWNDVAVYNGDSGAGDADVAVLFNDGSGALTAPVNYAASMSETIAAVDIDGDDDIDLIVPSLMRSRVHILLNRGDGGFVEGNSMDLRHEEDLVMPSWCVTKDIDGDGLYDLIVSDFYWFGEGGVKIYPGKEGGTFDPTPLFVPTGYLPTQIGVEDFDRDGLLDIFTPNRGDWNVALRLQEQLPLHRTIEP